MILMTALSGMMVFSAIGTEPEIYSVSLTDPRLQTEETYLSSTARAFARATDIGSLQCVDLSERNSDFARLCLTSGEWRILIDQLVEEANTDQSYAAFLADLDFQAGTFDDPVFDYPRPDPNETARETDGRSD